MYLLKKILTNLNISTIKSSIITDFSKNNRRRLSKSSTAAASLGSKEKVDAALESFSVN
jgi:hypothetical protein